MCMLVLPMTLLCMYITVYGNVLLLQQTIPYSVGYGKKSMQTAFPATTAPGPYTGAQSSGNAVVAAAVVVVVMIIAAMLAAVVGLVVILVMFRRRSKRSATAVLYTNDGKDSLKELDNPMYSGNLPSTSCMIINCTCCYCKQEHNSYQPIGIKLSLVVFQLACQGHANILNQFRLSVNFSFDIKINCYVIVDHALHKHAVDDQTNCQYCL